jgi:formate dehydrogenase subunit gamma
MARTDRPTSADFALDNRGRPGIERHTRNTRSNHWITAICFVLLAFSGLALFHPALFWLTAVLGGGPWTRILHPFIGVAMFASFMRLAFRVWQHNFLVASDWKWLRRIGDVANNRDGHLPPVGRYNAGQKLLFWTLLASVAGLLLTGIVIWRAYFSHLFPIGVIRAAALLHAFFAFVIICSILVHIYAAIWIQGSLRAMVRGTVSYGWARHHHARWYGEVVEREHSLARPADASRPRG